MLRLLSLSFCFLVAATAYAENWPGWRGPTGLGHSSAKDLPLTWSDKENIRWKAPLPDTGNATPAVWGDHIFLTQATEQGNQARHPVHRPQDRQREVVVLHRAQESEPTHGDNPYGSATPVTDGERVIASLGSAGVVCYDFAGKELWRKDLGEFIHIWGTASSPVLHGDLVLPVVRPRRAAVPPRHEQEDRRRGLAARGAGGDTRDWQEGREIVGRLVEHAGHRQDRRPRRTDPERAQEGQGLRPEDRQGTLVVRRPDRPGLHVAGGVAGWDRGGDVRLRRLGASR